MDRPWGLSRMEPYGQVISVPAGRLELDPETQVARHIGPDGRVVAAQKHGTNTGTENSTRTNRDGHGPGSVDQDHSQDSDKD